GIREVVFEGTSSGVLESGPGHLRNTVLPGQPGVSTIVGRQAAFGGPFRDLGQLHPEETFTVTTGQGTHTYRVTDLRRAGDPPPLARGRGRLTLATAEGRAFLPSGVLRVDADLVSDVQPAPTRSAVTLASSERLMAGDSSSWMPLVLWGQALVLAAAALAWAR